MDVSDLAAFIVPVIMISNMILAGIVVFIERRDIGSTWAWLMILYFVPIIGFIIYILFGRQLKQTNFYRLSSKERVYLQSRADKQLEQLTTSEWYRNDTLKKYSDLIKMNVRSSNALITLGNDLTIFSDGHDKFQALFRDIKHAKKEIHFQYYIIQRDSLGKKIRDELTKKAKEGVKVRILYDEIGSKTITRSFFKELKSFGGEVEVFFPSILKFINFRINNRNHRKLCIIDGKIAYVGGFNVGNEYLGLNKKFGYWRDTHIRIEGEAVNHINGRFILDWNYASKQKPDLEQLSLRAEKHHRHLPIQIIASGPNSETEHIKNMFIKLILSAKSNVYIQTPYFVPDTSFMDACKMALLSGVDVRIMFPNNPDHPFVKWASGVYAGELLKYGAKILLYDNGFMHAKTIVIDQEVASVGTANIDTRSFRLNFEVNAIIYDKNVAQQLTHLFMQDSQVSTELTMETYEKRSMMIKIKEAISRLLSPIL